MKAVICEEPGRLRLVERLEPKPGADEVLVRIRKVGVCGTDYHIFNGRQPFLAYPRVMGHELAGEVVAAPAGSGLVPGEGVYVVPYLACGGCAACRKGRSNCCQKIAVLGVHRDGGMAEYLAVPARNVVSAGDMPLADAAMIEFLAIGAHGVRRAAVEEGERVLVTGAGPIGIAAMIFARARGAAVTVLDSREDRLGFARDVLGADAAVLATPEAAGELARVTGGDGFDVVLDATGNVRAMNGGLAHVGHGGRYVLLSIVQDAITFPDPEFHKRETTLLASRNALPEDFAAVVQQMRAGAVPVRALRTHEGRLDDVPGLFAEWLRPETGVIKAMIEV